MKELTREITKAEVYGYEAFDGTVFDSKDACQNYENVKRKNIIEKLNNLVIAEITEIDLFGTGGDDYGWKVVVPHNVEDCKTIQQAIEMYGESYPVSDYYIGKEVMCYCELYGYGVWDVETIDEKLERIRQEYGYLMTKAKREKEN